VIALFVVTVMPDENIHRLTSDFVLLTAEEYDRLVTATDSTRAFHADNAPDEVATVMLAALENDR
jgi:hypothetical protein